MSETSFTPGPWMAFADGYRGHEIRAQGKAVGYVYGAHDAQLVTATPDFATLAGTLIARFGGTPADELALQIAEDPSTLTDCVALARAAVNKALGNEIFERLNRLSREEYEAAVAVVRRLARDEEVSDGELADAMFEMSNRLDIFNALLPLCSEMLERFMRHAGIEETPRGISLSMIEEAKRDARRDEELDTAHELRACGGDCPRCQQERAEQRDEQFEECEELDVP